MNTAAEKQINGSMLDRKKCLSHGPILSLLISRRADFLLKRIDKLTRGK
jgi:hypothetical protein